MTATHYFTVTIESEDDRPTTWFATVVREILNDHGYWHVSTERPHRASDPAVPPSYDTNGVPHCPSCNSRVRETAECVECLMPITSLHHDVTPSPPAPEVIEKEISTDAMVVVNWSKGLVEVHARP